ALYGVNIELRLILIEAVHRTYHDAIGVLAIPARFAHDVSHCHSPKKVPILQPQRTGELARRVPANMVRRHLLQISYAHRDLERKCSGESRIDFAARASKNYTANQLWLRDVPIRK